jgi:hypothetical protein
MRSYKIVKKLEKSGYWISTHFFFVLYTT